MRSIRERLQAMEPTPATRREPAERGVPIDQIAPGVEQVNAYGAYHLIETITTDPTDGGFAERCALIPQSLRFIAEDVDVTSPSDVLFLDTETTGLDRGTGTHVFLVGVGYFDGSYFRVRQYFIRDLTEEASLLHDLGQLLHCFPVLATFNGRTFDWPLLQNRFILHGYRNFPNHAHWDLLPVARRLWKHRLGDCSLGSLERRILGVERYGDVPGYLIPQLYFDYLRTRDARPLRPVFSHNHEDIVSLARLARVFLDAEHDPFTFIKHSVDRLSFGMYLLRRGEIDIGCALIEGCLDDADVPEHLRGKAFQELGTLYKRRRDWERATAIWERMCSSKWASRDLALYPLVELAKVYEHRFRHYDEAIRYTERAINLTDLYGWQENRSQLVHRYRRLIRRTESRKIRERT